MTTTEANVEVKVGREATDLLLDLVRRASRSVLIVSPWLSEATAELAVRKQREGVNVEVMTSADTSPSHLRALRTLIERAQRTVRKTRPELLTAGVIATIAGIAWLIYQAMVTTLTLAGALAGLAGLLAGGVLIKLGVAKIQRYWRARVSRLSIYPTEPLLHAKVYIADDIAAIGSPNFTVTGLTRSIESVAFLSGPGVAERIRRELEEKLREMPEEVPLDDVGRILQK